ncbi:MAG: hypothetical protein LBI84_02500 [Propionibacteriaceae bacterium]|jgi:hypothetical protein|nr:hypothetical protein [Propionibacteriaceae bacterium]
MTFRCIPYVGSGSYCHTNSLVMCLGDPKVTTALAETLSGSAFGFCLWDGALPLLSPPGWQPEIGLTQAIGLLGYECVRQSYADQDAALAALRDRLAQGPALVGPVDMGGLRHHADSDWQGGVGHFVRAVAVEETADGPAVVFHDPRGYPWARLPWPIFAGAWRADAITYCEDRFILRSGFRRARRFDLADALSRLQSYAVAGVVDAARRGLPDSAEAYQMAAEQARSGLPPNWLETLAGFSLPTGARRRQDAADIHAAVPGHDVIAELLQEQARLCGALQYAARVNKRAVLADGFVRLADSHERLMEELRGSAR